MSIDPDEYYSQLPKLHIKESESERLKAEMLKKYIASQQIYGKISTIIGSPAELTDKISVIKQMLKMPAADVFRMVGQQLSAEELAAGRPVIGNLQTALPPAFATAQQGFAPSSRTGTTARQREATTGEEGATFETEREPGDIQEFNDNVYALAKLHPD